MKQFTIHLQSPSLYERMDGVTRFVAVDESGSFGILPGHERMMTVLSPGIARLQLENGDIEYLGLAESVLYYVRNQLYISTAKYIRDRDYARLSAVLRERLQEEQQLRTEMRETVHRMEEALLRQLLKHPGELSL